MRRNVLIDYEVSKYVWDASVTFIYLSFSYLRYKLFITRMASNCSVVLRTQFHRENKKKKKAIW
jgi:hypothetical protein